jgi:cobalt/nickel transport system permease protein
LKTVNLPDWLAEDESCDTGSGKTSFVEKNITHLVRSLASLHDQRRTGTLPEKIHPAVKLPAVVLIILLISLGTATYIEVMSVILLVLLSMMPLQLLKRVLALGLISAAFTLVTLIPALWFGFGGHIFLVTARVWLSVSFSSLLALTTSRHGLVRALKIVHMPDLVILILDVTLKYIFVLTEVTLHLFYALKARSVGRSGRRAVWGIAGTLFLKSKEMAEELYGAMVCRGFSGTYRLREKPAFHLADGLCAGFILLLVCLFFILK